METLKRLYYTHLNRKKSKDFTPHVKKSKRSFWGNVILGLFLLAMAVAFFFPVVYMVSQSLKPMNEMFIFPPKILVSNPTMDNYRDFINVLANTVVPVTRSQCFGHHDPQLPDDCRNGNAGYSVGNHCTWPCIHSGSVSDEELYGADSGQSDGGGAD